MGSCVTMGNSDSDRFRDVGRCAPLGCFRILGSRLSLGRLASSFWLALFELAGPLTSAGEVREPGIEEISGDDDRVTAPSDGSSSSLQAAPIAVRGRERCDSENLEEMLGEETGLGLESDGLRLLIAVFSPVPTSRCEGTSTVPDITFSWLSIAKDNLIADLVSCRKDDLGDTVTPYTKQERAWSRRWLVTRVVC